MAEAPGKEEVKSDDIESVKESLISEQEQEGDKEISFSHDVMADLNDTKFGQTIEVIDRFLFFCYDFFPCWYHEFLSRYRFLF